MKEYLEKIPVELKSLIDRLRDIALKENLKAYLVGGFVRDLILGVKNLDLDISVEGDGIKFAASVADSLGAKIIAHRQFGTATVYVKPGLKIDFASARKEYYPKPAHLPVVSPGSLREDLYRRDFTINALAINLSDAQLVDYFGGQQDLKNKVIRVLHVLSFIDDPTRILRAIRFEQRYGFKIEPLTLRLLKEAVELGALAKVHPHRMRDELIPILKEKDPVKQIRRLEKLTSLDFIYPGLKPSQADYLFFKSIKSEIDWFNRKNVGRRPLDAWLVYLAGLFNPLDAPAIKKVCFKFGLRKGEESRLSAFKRMRSSDIKYLSGIKVQPLKMFKLLKPLSYETLIALRAKYQNRIFRRHTADFLEIYNEMRISVCGEDLRCLGVLPGPKYQRIFEQVLAAKLNGKVKNKEEELVLIKQLSKKSLLP